MKNYQILQEALDKATQRGAFNLQEVGLIMASLRGVHNDLELLPKVQEELEGYKKREGAAKNIDSLLKPEPKTEPKANRKTV